MAGRNCVECRCLGLRSELLLSVASAFRYESPKFWKTGICHVIVVLAAAITVCNGQATVTVSMPTTVSADEGSSAAIPCSYTVTDSSYSLYVITWKRGDSINTATDIAAYFPGDPSPVYPINGSRYSMTTDTIESSTKLTVSSVQFPNDEDSYWCIAQYSHAVNPILKGESSTMLTVIVLPTTMSLSDPWGSYKFPSGGTAYLVEGRDNQFTCEVPGINPGATFTWQVDGGGKIEESATDVTGSDGLTNSTSTATLSPEWDYHGKELQCKATNNQGNSYIVISVMIDVKVPPTAMEMSLSGPFGQLGDSVNVDQDTPYTFTCIVRDTRPAVTTQWYLNDILQSTTPPPIGNNSGLVDTTSTWTFTPRRDSHKQEVKCTANITESQLPYPDVMVSLNVTGPPNTPVIAATSPMTEGMSTTLTCTADMAFPDDWSLVWSNESTSIPGHSQSEKLTTDQRYNITSTVDFTPTRADNGNTINCTAQRGSWTPGPEGSWGPLDVQYEPNITNKAANEVGAQHGEDAELLCIAVGNPRPNITWLSPNNTEIFNDMSKYTVQSMITGGDSVFENIVTGNLTIRNVSSQEDYGQYTCISTNGIGSEDSLKINVTGPRQPDKPSGVRITDRTANSLTVRWTAGYDGGKDQWFHVGHLKSGDSSETMSDKITENDYTVTGLEAYTDYEIRVYAQNEIGKNPNYAQTSTKTLPNPPDEDSGIVIEFNRDEGTVKVEGLGGKDGCIQIEVQYIGSSEWSNCGECITADQTVVLDQHCPKPRQTRRKRAVGDIADVRASYCRGGLCSVPVPPVPPKRTMGTPVNTGIIAGGVIGCLALVAVIVGLGFYLRKTSPSKQKDVSCSSIELQGPDLNSDTGVSNEGLQGSGTGNTAIYAQVNKKGNQPKSFKAGGNANVTDSYLEMNNKPPARPEKPRNLPDVTYAVVDKEKKQPPPPPTQEGSKPPANKKKPKKYVPPSSRAEEESAYEDVMIDGKKAINPPPKEADDTYANFGEQQDNSGRVISEDGLIYAEVGHTKVHPPNQPPIRTEESTEYASLDFSRMKTNNST